VDYYNTYPCVDIVILHSLKLILRLGKKEEKERKKREEKERKRERERERKRRRRKGRMGR